MDDFKILWSWYAGRFYFSNHKRRYDVYELEHEKHALLGHNIHAFLIVIVTWTSTKCLFQSMLPCSVAFCQVIPMYWFNLFIAIQMMRYRVDIRKKKCWKVFSAVVMLCFDKCLFGCCQCCYNCFAMQPYWKARYCCKWRLIYPF